MISKNIQTIYDEITELTVSRLSGAPAEQNLCDMMHDIFEMSDNYCKELVNKDEMKHMDCKAGCSTCCRVNVPALTPEAKCISRFLSHTVPPEELIRLKDKMTALERDIRFLEEDERILANRECAFLNEKGACSIYPVRPLICRSVTSADSKACKEAMTMLALNEHVLVPMHIMQKSIYDTVFKGVANGMKKCGMNDKSSELTGAVLNFMQDI